MLFVGTNFVPAEFSSVPTTTGDTPSSMISPLSTIENEALSIRDNLVSIEPPVLPPVLVKAPKTIL
jgi:hypothetical protein